MPVTGLLYEYYHNYCCLTDCGICKEACNLNVSSVQTPRYNLIITWVYYSSNDWNFLRECGLHPFRFTWLRKVKQSWIVSLPFSQIFIISTFGNDVSTISNWFIIYISWIFSVNIRCDNFARINGKVMRIRIHLGI